MSMGHEQVRRLLNAHESGALFQWRFKAKGDLPVGQWKDDNRPLIERQAFDFDFSTYDYRIKPEPRKPREWWIYPVQDNRNRAIYNTPAAGFVHVREVLPDEEGK